MLDACQRIESGTPSIRRADVLRLATPANGAIHAMDQLVVKTRMSSGIAMTLFPTESGAGGERIATGTAEESKGGMQERAVDTQLSSLLQPVRTATGFPQRALWHPSLF